MIATKKPQILALLAKGESNDSISLKTGASLIYIKKLEKKSLIKDKPINKVKSELKPLVDNTSTNPALRTYWCREQ